MPDIPILKRSEDVFRHSLSKEGAATLIIYAAWLSGLPDGTSFDPLQVDSFRDRKQGLPVFLSRELRERGPRTLSDSPWAGEFS
jgi:hypothetical protein